MFSFVDFTLLAFFSMGPMEMLIVGGIAVLLFGSRLPEVARNLGKSYVEFKRGFSDIGDDVRNQVRNVQYEVEQAANTSTSSYYTPAEDDAPAAFTPPPAEVETSVPIAEATPKQSTSDQAATS